MILTVDLGNSRIKWALWQQAQIVAQGAHAYNAGTLAAVLSQAWGTLETPARVILACVAGAGIEASVQHWLNSHWQLTAQVLSSSQAIAGLKHGYAQPAQHGVDRWAAMIAARALYQSPLCVISCGTATTLDLIRADGQHLGGQIMPGSELMFEALRLRLPALAQLEFGDSLATDVFASNTAQAVQQGVLQMAAAGLDRGCDAARERLGEQMQTLITGGAATAMLALMKNSAELQPELVLHGLYIVSQQVQA